MKYTLMITILILTSLFPYSYANSGSIVVYVNVFTSSDRSKNSDLGEALAASVAETISSSSSVEVITHDARKKAMQELAFSQIASDNGTATAKILAADYIISGSYTISGENISISAEIIDMTDQRLIDSFHSEGRTSRISLIASNVGFNLAVLMKKHGLINHEIVENPENRIQPSLKAYTYYSLGLKAYYNYPGVAYEYFLKASTADPEYIDALIYAASTALDMSLYDSAIDLTANGEKIMNRYNLKYTVQYARLMLLRGMIYFKLENYSAASESYSTSINVLKYLKMYNTSYEAEAVNGLALILRKKGKFTDAFLKFNSALKILENIGMKNSIQYAEILNNLSALGTASGNFDNALKYNSDSLAIKNVIGLKISKTYAITLSSRGVIMSALKNNIEAIDLIDSSLKIFETLNLEDTDDYALAEANAGYCFAAMNNHKDAIKRFEIAQRIRNKTGSIKTTDYFKTSMKLARSYHALKEDCKALKTAEDSVKLFKSEYITNDEDLLFISELEKLCKH